MNNPINNALNEFVLAHPEFAENNNMDTDMTNTTTCPHCGAKRIAHPLDKSHTVLDCGSVEGWRTPLCYALQDREKIKEQLLDVSSEWKKKCEEVDSKDQVITQLRDEVDRLRNANLALRQIATDLTGVARGALFHCPQPARSDGDRIVARLRTELDQFTK